MSKTPWMNHPNSLDQFGLQLVGPHSPNSTTCMFSEQGTETPQKLRGNWRQPQSEQRLGGTEKLSNSLYASSASSASPFPRAKVVESNRFCWNTRSSYHKSSWCFKRLAQKPKQNMVIIVYPEYWARCCNEAKKITERQVRQVVANQTVHPTCLFFFQPVTSVKQKQQGRPGARIRHGIASLHLQADYSWLVGCLSNIFQSFAVWTLRQAAHGIFGDVCQDARQKAVEASVTGPRRPRAKLTQHWQRHGRQMKATPAETSKTKPCKVPGSFFFSGCCYEKRWCREWHEKYVREKVPISSDFAFSNCSNRRY